jgi:hypothetical protein
MGPRSKPRVTVLADPDEDDFDGVELVTFDTPRPTAFDDEPLIDLDPPPAALDDQLDAITAAIAEGDESAAAELVAASERASPSALVVEPTAPSAVDDEPYDEDPKANTDGPVLVASRRAGRRGLVLALLGLLAATVLAGAYLSHDNTPGPAVATNPPMRPAFGSGQDKILPAARPSSRMAHPPRPRRHYRRHDKPQPAPRAVAVAPAPAPAPAPVAPARPPVSAPAPRPASPAGGEFLIGGP